MSYHPENKKKKVVINACYGGFGLSDAAYEKLIEWGVPVVALEKNKEDHGKVIFDNTLTEYDKRPNLMGRYWDSWTRDERDNPLLVKVVEELGDVANGMCAKLIVVEIPDDVKYVIEEYDGFEHIAEKHRTWS